MKKIITVILAALVLISAIPVSAQNLPRAESVAEFWEMGERRVYLFHTDSARLGRLNSLMYGAQVDVYGNLKALKLQSLLALDLTPNDSGSGIVFEGIMAFDTAGHFVNVDYDLTIDGRIEKVILRYDSTSQTMHIQKGDTPEGYTTKPFAPHLFTYDPFLVDQLSIILALHDLNMGESFEVPIFSPQGMYNATFEFEVVDKVAISNTPLADSVWQVEILRPCRQTAYVDKHNRLIQLRDRDREITAELSWIDASVNSKKEEKKTTTETISGFRDRIPQYGIYLLAALIWLLFLGRNGFNEKWSYLLFVAGALVYLLIYITHDPLQQAYGRAYLTNPQGSVAWLGIVPSLITGIIHETLKLLPLLIIARLLKPRVVMLIALGAFIGAGFGYFEACQTSLSSDLILKLILAANVIFMILFHTASGALLGYGLGRRKIAIFFPIMIGVNAFMHYLAFMIGSGKPSLASIKNLTIYQALIGAAMLTVVLIFRFKFTRAQETGSKKRKR
ncbi:MAG: PrsW family intramembrane metalloprotease [FCB group bacterium]|nr:PrsW family intramembrane metalloprotease [FCB group bacterium]